MASAIQHPRSPTAREYDSLLHTGARTVGADGIRDTTPGEATQLANTIRSYTRGTDRRSGWHPRYNVGGATQIANTIRSYQTARTVGADGIRDTTPGEATPLANTIRSYTRGTDRRSGWHPRYNVGGAIQIANTIRSYQGSVGADGIRDTTPGEATQLANTMRSYTRGTDRRSGWHPRYNTHEATQLANTMQQNNVYRLPFTVNGQRPTANGQRPTAN